MILRSPKTGRRWSVDDDTGYVRELPKREPVKPQGKKKTTK